LLPISNTAEYLLKCGSLRGENSLGVRREGRGEERRGGDRSSQGSDVPGLVNTNRMIQVGGNV
jgi:hypothetical protein